MLAADEAGPLRHRYGTPCEQVVGVSYVDAEGRLHHSDGWSMRGTDGPGLNQVLCGSQGALALLVSATMRAQAGAGRAALGDQIGVDAARGARPGPAGARPRRSSRRRSRSTCRRTGRA